MIQYRYLSFGSGVPGPNAKNTISCRFFVVSKWCPSDKKYDLLGLFVV